MEGHQRVIRPFDRRLPSWLCDTTRPVNSPASLAAGMPLPRLTVKRPANNAVVSTA